MLYGSVNFMAPQRSHRVLQIFWPFKVEPCEGPEQVFGVTYCDLASKVKHV